MAKLKVLHFKPDCISCGACAAIAPEFWEMDDEGLAQLKGSNKINANQDEKTPEEHWELEIKKDQKEANQDASDVCPVQIIKVQEE
ncbi:ferredoxin [archaeon]|jgi:ferredoxin|nr:ferredoxin [archaeon]MBT6697942.1 ferredoxin [archaeon]